MRYMVLSDRVVIHGQLWRRREIIELESEEAETINELLPGTLRPNKPRWRQDRMVREAQHER